MRKLANEELNRISVEDYKKTEKTPIVIVLDNVRSLNNIGSVFRTADAFLSAELLPLLRIAKFIKRLLELLKALIGNMFQKRLIACKD
jgi:tRNA G18 (ribose-2'-O)-methylase SpoU